MIKLVFGSFGHLPDRFPIHCAQKDVLEVPFQIGCGSDGVCVSDLTISTDLDQPFVEPYVIGSSEFVTLVFTVRSCLFKT